MSRTLPRAAGGMPGKLVSLMTFIAGAEDTERISRRVSEDSSAENCERQVRRRWIFGAKLFWNDATREKDCCHDSRNASVVDSSRRCRREIPRCARNGGLSALRGAIQAAVA